MKAKPKIAILGLTLELYETLAPSLRPEREAWVRRRIVPAMETFAEVYFNRAVFRAVDIENIVRDAETAGYDAIVVMLLSYSPSLETLPALQRTHLPILLWNTQELHGVDMSFGEKQLIDNHGVHGTQDLCNVLLRSGVKFQYVTSHVDDENALAQVEDFCTAAAAVNKLRRARVGLLGYPFPGMGDFAVEATFLRASLGATQIPLSVQDYVDHTANADADSVSRLVREYRDQYDMDGEVTRDDLEATARAELAMRGMVREHQLDAVSFQFLALGRDERTETLPFVAVSRMMADGVGFGGEGDVIAALGTMLLNQLQPPATFSEIFTIDFAGNSVLMSHMGEMNIAMARRDRKTALLVRSPIAPTIHHQLVLKVNVQPGPATFYALTLGPNGRWRMITADAEVLDYTSASLAAPHFKLRPNGDIREFLTAYARAGGPHHNAVCFGDATNKLQILADILGAEYIHLG